MKVKDIICDHEFNCRGVVTQESCQELADSIREIGLLNPITVRLKDGHWQVVAGHRRITAVMSLGWEDIDVIKKDLTDEQAYKINLQENLGRRDLTPTQEMRSIIRIYGDRPDIDIVVKDLGKGRTWVISRLAIRTLPEEVQRDMDKGQLTAGDLDVLISVPFGEKLSVAKLLIAHHEAGKSATKLTAKYRKKYKAKTMRHLKAALSVFIEQDREPKGFDVLGWCLGDVSSEEFFGVPLDELERYGILE